MSAPTLEPAAKVGADDQGAKDTYDPDAPHGITTT